MLLKCSTQKEVLGLQLPDCDGLPTNGRLIKKIEPVCVCACVCGVCACVWCVRACVCACMCTFMYMPPPPLPPPTHTHHTSHTYHFPMYCPIIFPSHFCEAANTATPLSVRHSHNLHSHPFGSASRSRNSNKMRSKSSISLDTHVS